MVNLANENVTFGLIINTQINDNWEKFQYPRSKLFAEQ